MIKNYYVYTHSRKSDGVVFYVGCATYNPKRRGKDRYQRAYDFGQRTHAWRLEAQHGITTEIVFETEDRGTAFAKEIELISFYGRSDRCAGTLVNQCDGGAGAGGQVSTESSRVKKSLTKRGEKNPMFGRTGAAHPNSRKVKDTKSGTVYDSVQIAADANGLKMKTLYNRLAGHRPNTTSLEFA